MAVAVHRAGGGAPLLWLLLCGPVLGVRVKWLQHLQSRSRHVTADGHEAEADTPRTAPLSSGDFTGGWGLLVHAVPDDYCDPPKEAKVCNGKSKRLKAKRAPPHIYYSELAEAAQEAVRAPAPTMSESSQSLVVLPGPVNGWNGATTLRVERVECSCSFLSVLTSTKLAWSLRDSPQALLNLLKANATDKEVPCARHKLALSVRQLSWTGEGYTEGNPGFVVRFAYHIKSKPVIYGEELLDKTLDDEVAVYASVFTHRYAKAHESWEDWFTYHSGVVLEWEHGRYVTVVEFAYRNGLGGWGQSNWYRDMDVVQETMPVEFVKPWDIHLGEVRLLDMEVTDRDGFGKYLKHYADRGERFIDPYFPWAGLNHTVLRDRRSRRAITNYILNYVHADGSYRQRSRDCQSFAADFYEFLTGQSGKTKTLGSSFVYKKQLEQFETDRNK